MKRTILTYPRYRFTGIILLLTILFSYVGDFQFPALAREQTLDIQADSTPTFSDVPESHTLHNYIQAMWDGGYTAGCSTDPLMYCPDQTMTRAMSAVFMLRGNFGATYVPPAAPWGTFSDDWFQGPWAEKWAEGMWDAGLTAGCLTDPLRFCPWDQFPRVQAAVFALRMAHGMSYTPPAATGMLFSDMTDTSFWGTKWVEQAYRDGLMPPCDSLNGKLTVCPNDLVDRAWGAYMIVQAKQLPLSNTVSDVSSLIAAINQSNSNGPDLDIINLATGVYTLTSSVDGYNGLPVISGALIIHGNGATIQRGTSAPAFRFFNVASTGKLTLDNLTLEGGIAPDDGGAIYNNGGTLSVLRSKITGNSTPTGLQAPYGRGGGIYSSGGIVTITDTTISNNTIDRWGGAVFVGSGNLNILYSTISSNSGNSGAGIEASTGTTTSISHSTFTNNIARFAPAIDADTLIISDSTISNNKASFSSSNSAAIRFRMQLLFINSILAGNLGGGFRTYASYATIQNSCIMGNSPDTTGYVISSQEITKITATGNYWGKSDGPSGTGPGNGDSVNSSVTFSPFLTSPPSFCPSGPIITAISAWTDAPLYPWSGSPQYYTIPNGQMSLSAKVYGAEDYNSDVAWSIISGSGNLSSTSGSSITFTAAGTAGNLAVVRATSVGDPTLYSELTLLTANVGLSRSRSSTVVLTGDSVPFKACLIINGSTFSCQLSEFNWSIVNGGGTLTYDQKPEYTSGPYVTYNAPDSSGVATVRVTPRGIPAIYNDFPITINETGPHHCSNVSLPTGSIGFTVGSGGLQANYPYVTTGNISEYDPLIGESQSVTVHASVYSPSTVPMDSVVIKMYTDNGSQEYPLSLISGTNLNGDWQATWIVNDTHCSSYNMGITVSNAVHQDTILITMK